MHGVDHAPADIDLDALVGRHLQARGRRQVLRILAAARTVLAEVGPEAATTNHIARVAGISPGSLYQYFANLDAIVDGVAAQYLAGYRAVAEELTEPPAGADAGAVVADVVDRLVAYNVANPGLAVLLAEPGPAERLADGRARLDRLLHERLAAVIGAVAPDVDDPGRAVDVCVAIFKGLLPHVLAAEGADRAAWTRELRRALTAYVLAEASGSTGAIRAPASPGAPGSAAAPGPGAADLPAG